ncbi:cytidine deaminase [Neptunicella sp. SCSIO 80796]|uniref:cytidine deaminase n=1 Tax=Neptunicella plasticusilytica TaxID=3117012 RepID=UPI003A4D6636
MNTLSQSEMSKLMAAAEQTIDKAYEPYSRYPVGAAVLVDNGKVITGVNVENAAYPSGLCAERVALGSAVSQGHRNIIAIAVYSPKGDISPCGMCRQFISEFGADILLIFQWQGALKQVPIKQLLPFSFDHKMVNA